MSFDEFESETLMTALVAERTIYSLKFKAELGLLCGKS